MGYTHYLYRDPEIDNDDFQSLRSDVRKILDAAEAKGIDLAGPMGTGDPILSADEIAFNGAENQQRGPWTTDEEITIPWPAETAGITEPDADPVAEKTEGRWFVGDLVSQHVAPKGSGSYESFIIQRVQKESVPTSGEKAFSFCKTAYRPYDIPVCATLIAAQHHLGDQVRVSSDGTHEDWMPGILLAMNAVGYGEQFDIWE